jgi:hypothetical protein
MGVRWSPSGSAAAMPRKHQARDKLRPVEVDDLRIAAVGYLGRRKQHRWCAGREPGQEAGQPRGIRRRRQHAAHQFRFHQRR